jgi:hypothetical protein
LDETQKNRDAGNRTISQLIGDGARVLPEKSHGWFRDWFRKVWKIRGGGLYALGFAVSFIYFEVGSLGEDILGVGSVFNGHALDFFIDFIVDSFTNTLSALIWPVYVVQVAPPWGAIALGLAFVVFTSFIKPPIERWVFPEESTEENQGP